MVSYYRDVTNINVNEIKNKYEQKQGQTNNLRLTNHANQLYEYPI